jgi:hypothetical protein
VFVTIAANYAALDSAFQITDISLLAQAIRNSIASGFVCQNFENGVFESFLDFQTSITFISAIPAASTVSLTYIVEIAVSNLNSQLSSNLLNNSVCFLFLFLFFINLIVSS